MPKVEQTLNDLKNFVNSLITTDLSTDKITEYNGVITKIDEAIVEDKKTNDDLIKAKDVIVNMVKTQGSSEKPKDESGGEAKTPRSLEQIAKDLISGGK